MSTPAVITPLQKVPAKARAIAYWASYFIALVLGATSVAQAVIAATDPDKQMPLWLLVVFAVAFFLQSQLSQIAGSNVTPDESTPGDLNTVVGQLVDARQELATLRKVVTGAPQLEALVEQLGAVSSHVEALVEKSVEKVAEKRVPPTQPPTQASTAGHGVSSPAPAAPTAPATPAPAPAAPAPAPVAPPVAAPGPAAPVPIQTPPPASQG